MHASSSVLRWRFGVVRAVACVVASLILFGSSRALAWTPPPLRGHVVDEAGALAPEEARQLDRKLDRARQEIGYAIVVYLLPKLPEGMTIEDVGYNAGNTWGVGSKAGADGVLLIASLGDRKLRIETGKGAGGALTDIASSHINREVIGPLLREGRTYDAMDRGVDAIVKELRDNTPGGVNEAGRDKGSARKKPGPATRPHAAPTTGDYVKGGLIAGVVLLVIVLAIVSPTFREILFWVFLFGRFGGGGGGRGRDDDDGGSGYGGGGGTFGGGGSSDDY